MDNSEFTQKVKLFNMLGIDLWLKKSNYLNKESKLNYSLNLKKYIIIQDSLKIKHEKVLEDFFSAVKKNKKDISLSVLKDATILETIEKDISEDVKKLYLIICDSNFLKLIQNQVLKENMIKKINNTFLFNTSFASDTITNDIKKLLWRDFLKIKDYE
tara:strand:- start:465 stop:938 length:474 start_codon:yes stop_codon:yes gene_type:complete